MAMPAAYSINSHSQALFFFCPLSWMVYSSLCPNLLHTAEEQMHLILRVAVFQRGV